MVLRNAFGPARELLGLASVARLIALHSQDHARIENETCGVCVEEAAGLAGDL
jgi:hypothetical protein